MLQTASGVTPHLSTACCSAAQHAAELMLCCMQPEGVLLPAKQHEQRAKFHAGVWAKAHQLGDPVAACFFKTAAGE